MPVVLPINPAMRNCGITPPVACRTQIAAQTGEQAARINVQRESYGGLHWSPHPRAATSSIGLVTFLRHLVPRLRWRFAGRSRRKAGAETGRVGLQTLSAAIAFSGSRQLHDVIGRLLA